jgi:hypothetical protein
MTTLFQTCSPSASHIATDGQLVSQSVRYLLLFHTYGLVFVGAPSLTRERVYLFYMLLAFASAVYLGSESQLYCLRCDFPFCRLLRFAGSRWRYSTPPPHGVLTKHVVMDF